MKFNQIIQVVLNEDVQPVVKEMARIPDWEKVQGFVNKDYDKAAVRAALTKHFKEKPQGYFSKVVNGSRDLDIGEVFTSAIDNTIEKLSLDSPSYLKQALFNYHGHNNNVTKNELAQEVWRAINDELGVNIPKTKIKSTLLQVKSFMKANADLFLSDEAVDDSKGTSPTPDAPKNYKVVKNTSDPEVQEMITNQFDRRVARAAKLLEQGEVLPVAEIKSFFDTFDFETMTIVKFLLDNDIIQTTNEILSSPENDEEEDEKDLERKARKGDAKTGAVSTLDRDFNTGVSSDEVSSLTGGFGPGALGSGSMGDF